MYATFPRRLEALSLDAVVVILLSVGIFALLPLLEGFPTVTRMLRGVWLIAVFLYEPIQVPRHGGTIGHRVLNLKVVDDRTGASPTFWKALGREFLKFLLGGFSFLTMAQSRRHRALHDILTRSTVQLRDPIRAKPHHYLFEGPAPPAPRDGVLVGGGAGRIERSYRLSLYVISAVATIYGCLAAAAQLPDLESAAWAPLILLSLGAALWARVQRPGTTHPVAEIHGGFWLFVLAPILLPYYLVATRRGRSARRAIAVGATLFAPLVGPGATTYVAPASIPPRFVQLKPQGPWLRVTEGTRARIVHADFVAMTNFLRTELAAGRPLPQDIAALYERWYAARPDEEREPTDPFSGTLYYYEKRGDGFILQSPGPDRQFDTPDDLSCEWPAADSTGATRWDSVATGPRLVPLGTAGGAVFGWDPQSVVRVGSSRFTAWWERRYEDSTHSGRYELDCSARRYRLLNLVERDNSRTVIREETVPRAVLTWWDVVPGTDGEALFLAVCGIAASRHLPVVRR